MEFKQCPLFPSCKEIGNWDCTFPTLNEAALRGACTSVEVSGVMHLFMEKLMEAANPERCWESVALYWLWDQEYKDVVQPL